MKSRYYTAGMHITFSLDERTGLYLVYLELDLAIRSPQERFVFTGRPNYSMPCATTSRRHFSTNSSAQTHFHSNRGPALMQRIDAASAKMLDVVKLPLSVHIHFTVTYKPPIIWHLLVGLKLCSTVIHPVYPESTLGHIRTQSSRSAHDGSPQEQGYVKHFKARFYSLTHRSFAVLQERPKSRREGGERAYGPWR